MGGIGVAAAIVVGLLSSFIQSLGLTIQRKSHIQDACLPLTSQRPPYRRPLWLIGFTIFITSNIFATIFQLDALPIVILAPLGAVSLIYNALLAKLLLGDSFGRRTIFGTGLVGLGATGIAVFGVVEEGEHPLEEILRLWARPAFLAFFWTVMGLTIIVLVLAHIVSISVGRKLRSIRLAEEENDLDEPASLLLAATTAALDRENGKPATGLTLPPASQKRRWSSPIATPRNRSPTRPNGTSGGPRDKTPSPTRNGAPPPLHFVRFAPAPSSPPPPSTLPRRAPSQISGPSGTPQQAKLLTICGLAFASASGVLSGMSLVLAKAAVELLLLTLEYLRTGKGSNQFAQVQSWFLVAGLAIGGLSQLVYLNYSLTFASPALVCPLAFCFFNLSSIFDGLVFYDQFSRLATHQIILVSFGVFFLMLGVLVVSAVRPTGDGGIDVGTWVEEEDEGAICLMGEDVLGAGAQSDEPDGYFRDSEDDAAAGERGGSDGRGRPPPLGIDIAASIASESVSPGWQSPLSPTRSHHPQPPVRAHSHSHTQAAPPFSPPLPSLSSSGMLTSPTQPRRRPRYGTLIPELAPVGAPTGFSIGLGAASPGFVIRPEHFQAHGQGYGSMGDAIGAPGVVGGRRGSRVRSRSEGTEGIQSVMRGGQGGLPSKRSTIDDLPSVSPASSSPGGLGIPGDTRGGMSSSTSALPDPPTGSVGTSPNASVGPDPALDVERIDERGHRVILVNPPLASEDGYDAPDKLEQPKRSLWDRMWNRKGKIRLDHEQG